MKSVLLIGNGNMGSNHLRVLNKLKKKYQLKIETCDSNIERGADYFSAEIALDINEWDYVIIATPTDTHSKMLDLCLNFHVKNIFVEKPIVEKPKNMAMIRYAGSGNIMVGHIERFNPIVKKIKEMIKGKEIDTVICTRSGLEKKEDDFNVDMDLIIHDLDVCRSLINIKLEEGVRLNKNNSCNFVMWNGYKQHKSPVMFFHSDNKSKFKRRMIQIIGKGFFIEGDYMNQTLTFNGKEIKIKKEEPLKLELEYFLNEKYTGKDISDAIANVRTLWKCR